MTYGQFEDVLVIKNSLGMEAFQSTLDHAPSGVFDARSWAYWNLLCGRQPALPLPQRR